MSGVGVSSSVGAWLLPALGHTALILGLVARLIISGPRYQRTFDEYGLRLPFYTELVLALSRAWYVLVPLGGVLLVVSIFMLIRNGGLARRPGWLWFWLVAGAILSAWVLVELSFLMPLLKLQEGFNR